MACRLPSERRHPGGHIAEGHRAAAGVARHSAQPRCGPPHHRVFLLRLLGLYLLQLVLHLSDHAARDLELHATARYAMLPGLGMALGSCCGGWINDRLTKRYGPRVGRCFFASAAVILAAVFIGIGPTIVDVRLAR